MTRSNLSRLAAALDAQTIANAPAGTKAVKVSALKVGDVLVSAETLTVLGKITRIERARRAGYLILSLAGKEPTSRHTSDILHIATA